MSTGSSPNPPIASAAASVLLVPPHSAAIAALVSAVSAGPAP
jgi:hypothetical protein